MKDIEFRGKREDTNKWVYGYYVKDYFNDKCFIVVVGDPVLSHMDLVEVIPETVGQYLGFPDIDKTRNYEGDAVEITYSDLAGDVHQRLIIMKHPFDYSLEEAAIINYSNKLKVIGNIYDNPEIKGG